MKLPSTENMRVRLLEKLQQKMKKKCHNAVNAKIWGAQHHVFLHTVVAGTLVWALVSSLTVAKLQG